MDNLIHNIMDSYIDIKSSTNDRKGFKKITNYIKYKRYMNKLYKIIDDLPTSDIKISTNGLLEYISYLIHYSNIDSFGCIKQIIAKPLLNGYNIYILKIEFDEYGFNIKIDPENLFMYIDIRHDSDDINGSISANTKLEALSYSNNNIGFIHKAISSLNSALLKDISIYVRRMIDS